MATSQKFIIADDHPMFRQALKMALSDRMQGVEWLEADSAESLDLVLQQQDIDLLLLDLHIPGSHGFSTLVHVRSHFPLVPVVVVSAYEDRDTIQRAVGHGASGFVPKSAPATQAFEAIQQVLAGGIWVPEPGVLACQQAGSEASDKIASLTPQQFKILSMFAEGLLNKQIAAELNVSEATIKAHATAVFRKLGVTNRTQAVIMLGQLELDRSSSEQFN